MNIDQLKKLISEQGTKIDTLTFTFGVNVNLKGLIDFFKENQLEIRNLELRLSEGLSPTERSRLISQFNEILLHIKGLNALHLYAPIKDYALATLLANPAVQALEELELSHRVEEDLGRNGLVNSKEFFETSLAAYLNRNQNLKALAIDDPNLDIKAKKYPQLKAALLKHPHLIRFNQGMAVDLFHEQDILSQDPQLIARFRENIHNTPAERKAKLKDALNSVTGLLLAYVENGFRAHPGNTWLTVQTELNKLLVILTKLERTYKEVQDDGTISSQAFLAVLINYVSLIKQAVILQTKKTLGARLGDSTALNHFWGLTRIDLLNKIRECRNDGANIPQLLEEIKSESQKLKEIRAHMIPVVFPSSYKKVSHQGARGDGLEQALQLLVDYTKGNSAISRFFHGHWNRHYTDKVNSIVERIHKDINSVEDLLLELDTINITNPKGSLARRIRYIEENCQSSRAEISAESSSNLILV